MAYRVCKRGWEFAQIHGINGAVSMCTWPGDVHIGNLVDNTMEEIWHSEAANRFRESLIDGSYRYCSKEKCPYLSHGTLEDYMETYDEIPKYPKFASLSYESNCNYDCTCCTDRDNEVAHQPGSKEKLEKIEKEVLKFINDVNVISANGRGELFVSNHIINVLHNWKPNIPDDEVEVILETNGALFDEEHWKKIENLGKYNLKVTITVMGFDEKTYQFLSGVKYPVQKIIDNLNFVKTLRKKGVVNFFEIGTVLQERNFREMPEFARRCIKEFSADCVRIRPYFPFADLDPSTHWLYDIRNPHHPYYSEYLEMLKEPIMKHEKVLMWSGDEVSAIGKNPYVKDKENYEVIKWIATDKEFACKFKDYINKKGYESISIYGCGFTGYALIQCLEGYVQINSVIDKYKAGECIDEKNIISIEQYDLAECGPIVVSSPYWYETVANELEVSDKESILLNIKDIVDSIECY